MDYSSNFDGCGGKLVDYSGNFYSTGYPKPYDNNLNCEWQLISPEKDQFLIISIKDLNVSSFICKEQEQIDKYLIKNEKRTENLYKDFKVIEDQSTEKPTCFDDEKIEIYVGTENNARDTLITSLCGFNGKFADFSIEPKYGKHSYATVVFKTGNHPRNPPNSNNFDAWNGFWFSWTTK